MWLWQKHLTFWTTAKTMEHDVYEVFSAHCWNKEVIDFNCIDVQEFRIDY